MKKQFNKMICKMLRKKRWILIYPEQKMWFNYRKPRNPKRGAYYYAAKNNVLIVPLFVEIQNLDEKETEEFYKVKYVVHALPPIYPEPELTTRENSFRMMEKDYEQKKQAYEEAYGKKLDYAFEDGDIAGWVGSETE